jgi:hypothetical protein
MTDHDLTQPTFGGFTLRDQELKYNLTLFDLIMTLAARVSASLKLQSKKDFRKNPTELRTGQHIAKLMKRMRYMEQFKDQKPLYS